MKIGFKYAGTVACLLAILMMLGGHWAVLQSVAWARMLVNYSTHEPILTALTKTFDGKHPCAMCLLVKQGRQQEQRENKQTPEPKLEHGLDFLLDLQSTAALLLIVRASGDTPFIDRFYPDIIKVPPTPPPRCCFAVL